MAAAPKAPSCTMLRHLYGRLGDRPPRLFKSSDQKRTLSLPSSPGSFSSFYLLVSWWEKIRKLNLCEHMYFVQVVFEFVFIGQLVRKKQERRTSVNTCTSSRSCSSSWLVSWLEKISKLSLCEHMYFVQVVFEFLFIGQLVRNTNKKAESLRTHVLRPGRVRVPIYWSAG